MMKEHTDKIRVVFMGSAELACPTLEGLLAHSGVELVGVVTQPDRPKGRKLKTCACATKVMAADSGIAVLTPRRVNEAESLAAIRALRPDLVVVVAYGQILRTELLSMPRLGCINVHASLLPKYRGAAPIQWAVARGERETGVTIMYMNEGMDEGDMILKRTVPIGDDDTAGTLHDCLAEVGASALVEVVSMLAAGESLPREPQNEDAATYAPKLSRRDGRIDWSMTAAAIRNRVRGFNPWPACHCVLPGGEGIAGKTLKVLEAVVESGEGAPGEVLAVSGAGPLVATGEGALRLVRVQPEGGKVMGGDAYLRGHPIPVGEVLPGGD